MQSEIHSLLRRSLSDGFNADQLQKLAAASSRLVSEERRDALLSDREHYVESDPVELLGACQSLVQTTLGAGFQLVDFRGYQCASHKHSIATVRHLGSQIEFQLVPGGTYQMGTEILDAESNMKVMVSYTLWEHYHPETEQPQHQVTIKPFLLGRVPLSGKDWKGAKQRSLPLLQRQPRAQQLELPLTELSYKQSKNILRSLDRRFRLPSEAEWEYACRAGSTTHYFWGDDFDPRYCWFKGNALAGPQPWSRHQNFTNAFGLIDMLGNVTEWCADDWIGHYATGPDTEKPRNLTGTRSPVIKVRRGGDWSSDAGECRSASRDFRTRKYQQPGSGVRVAMSIF